jgi:acetyl esterase/lipase
LYPRALTHPPLARSQRHTYATVNGQDLHVQLYQPRHGSSRQPVLIWVHGGGWFRGQPTPCPIAWLTTHGYTVAAVEYRLLSRESPFPAQLDDLRTALDWLRANSALCQADPERIGLVGASAGGLLATLLGLDPANRLDCVVTFFPVTDPARLLSAEHPVDWRMRFAVRKLLRSHDAAVADTALLRAVNARAQVSPRAAPHLVVHGTHDRWIPPQHSLDFIAALQEAGVDAQIHLVPGIEHGDPRIASPQVQAAVLVFLRRHLGTDPAVASAAANFPPPLCRTDPDDERDNGQEPSSAVTPRQTRQ